MADSSKKVVVQVLQLPQCVDERGSLTWLEGNVHIPFKVERVFWISDVPDGKTRGGHAHRTCHEFIVPLHGSFEIIVDDGSGEHCYKMNRKTEGIVIPAGTWCELKNFEPGTECLVLASHPYQQEGYWHNHEEWMKERNELNVCG